MRESTHVSVFIRRAPAEVYGYAVDPANLPAWAAGLAGGVERVDGRWFSQSPMGRVEIEFVAANRLGVLDHEVRLPSGEVFYNPMRVVPDRDGAEVIFTVRRTAAVTDEDHARDVDAVRRDLSALRQILEQ